MFRLDLSSQSARAMHCMVVPVVSEQENLRTIATLRCISTQSDCKPPGSSQVASIGHRRRLKKRLWWKCTALPFHGLHSKQKGFWVTPGPHHETGSWETGLISPLFLIASSTFSQKPLHLFCPVARAGVVFFSYNNVSAELVFCLIFFC